MTKRKILSSLIALVLVVTSVMVPPSAVYARPDGSNVLTLQPGDAVNITPVQNRSSFASVATGVPLEANVLMISGGNMIDQMAFCLEHGSPHPPRNVWLDISDVYKWEEHPDFPGDMHRRSMVFNQTTRQPVPQGGLTLRNGYTLTDGDIFGLDTIINNRIVLGRQAGLSYDRISYAAQNAVRAFMNEIAGISWLGNPVSYAGGLHYRADGLLQAGTLRAVTLADNEVLRFSYELFRLGLRARASNRVISESQISLVVLNHTYTETTATFQIQVNTTSSTNEWMIQENTVHELDERGGSVSATEGFDGAVITVTIPNTTEAMSGFALEVVTREIWASGNLRFAEPRNSGYQTVMPPSTEPNPGTSTLITFLPHEPYDDTPPLPVPPPFIFEGRKLCSYGGLDGDNSTPRGDGTLAAGFEVWINGVLEDVFWADNFGQNAESRPIHIFNVAEMTPTIVYHDGAERPQSIHWEATAHVRIVEIVPRGYLSEAESNTGTGEREFTIRFQARNDRQFRLNCSCEEDGPTPGCWYVSRDWHEVYEYLIQPPDTGWNRNMNTRRIPASFATFTNRIMLGHLHVNKAYEKDFDPWGDVPSTKVPMEGARFTMRLVSGGLEGHPYVRAVRIQPGEPGYDPWANSYRLASNGVVMNGRSGPESAFRTSQFGQIRILDIPYGNYQFTEVEASGPGFVLTYTGINISHDGQLLSRDIVNYVIRGEIEIVKVDSETGNRVPSDQTAVRIRYMGNINTPPDQRYRDPNFGRYIANQVSPSGATSYIFWTCANGRIKLPFSLPYGVWQLEEIVAPPGYFLGQYGGDGLGRPVNDDGTFIDVVTIYDADGNPVQFHVDSRNLPFVIHRFYVDQMGASATDHPLIEIQLRNHTVRGKIEILKTADTIVGWNEQRTEFGMLNVPVFEARPQDGITFDIFAASDRRLPDGVDAPLFVDTNGNPIAMDTVLEDHALWTNALRVEERIMPDGTQLAIVTERFPNVVDAMATANMLTATGRPNIYELEFSVEDGDFTIFYTYEIQAEYTPDGFTIVGVTLYKRTVYRYGTINTLFDLSLFPEVTWFEVESGGEVVTSIENYRNRVFENRNEMSVEYMWTLPNLVRSNEPLLIEPLFFFAQPEMSFGTGFHTFANANRTVFYSAMWTDDKSRQVWARHTREDINYSRYYVFTDYDEIRPIEHTYVEFNTEVSGQLYWNEEIFELNPNTDEYELIDEILHFYPQAFNEEPLFLLEERLPYFIWSTWNEEYHYEVHGIDDPLDEQFDIFIAVDIDGIATIVPVDWNFRAWENLPRYGDFRSLPFPEVRDYSVLFVRMLDEDRFILMRSYEWDELNTDVNTLEEFENLPMFIKFITIDGEELLRGCTQLGEIFDTKVERFEVQLYRSPNSQDAIFFEHDGLIITIDVTEENGMVNITRPYGIPVIHTCPTTIRTNEGLTTGLLLQVTRPSVFMQLNDGTRVGMLYSGGFAFTEIKVPFENVLPTLYHGNVQRNLTINEYGRRLDPSNPILDVIPHDASGDRIQTELVMPPHAVPGYTVIRIATRQTRDNAIVLKFPDGRNMYISTRLDQYGARRGHVEITAFTPTLRFLLGELVETVVTGTNGTGRATSGLLPLGTYIIRERGAADSVLVEDSDFVVTLTYENNFVPLIWGSIEAENRLASIQLNLKKLFQESYGSTNFVPRAGAVFGVFTNQVMSANGTPTNPVDKAMLSPSSLVSIMTTDSRGMATSIFKAPFGEYYVRELRTLAGYELNTNIFPFTYDAGAVSEPLRIEFTDLGIQVDFRHQGDFLTDMVIRTLHRIPAITYIVNGAEIDTTREGLRAIGSGVSVNSVISYNDMDHRATVRSTNRAAVVIDFDDGYTIMLTPRAGGYGMEFTYGSQAPLVTLPLHASTVVTNTEGGQAIDFQLGLSSIRYRTTVTANAPNVSKPQMRLGDAIIFRELSLTAGTDRLVISGISADDFTSSLPLVTDAADEYRHSMLLNQLPASGNITIDGNYIGVSFLNGVLTLDDRSGEATITVDGRSATDGIQVSGSYVNTSAGRIIYFNRDITINDTANSNELIQTVLGATFTGGTINLNNMPLMVYQDGVSIAPSTSIALEQLTPYTIVMSDGQTIANVVLMHDNSLNMSLDGTMRNNLMDYQVSHIVSQGTGNFIVDANGNIIEQGAGIEGRTIDNIRFFSTESRTYNRADGFAPVTVININTADGIKQGILNRLRPGGGGGGGNNSGNGGTEPHDPREPEIEEPDVPKVKYPRSIRLHTQAHTGDGHTQYFIPGDIIDIFDDIFITKEGDWTETSLYIRVFLFGRVGDSVRLLYESDYIRYTHEGLEGFIRYVKENFDTLILLENEYIFWAERIYSKNPNYNPNDENCTEPRRILEYEHNFNGYCKNQWLRPLGLGIVEFDDPGTPRDSGRTDEAPQTGVDFGIYYILMLLSAGLLVALKAPIRRRRGELK